MKIALVTPAGPGTRNGNRHTALRWAAFLRAAGHRVSVSTEDLSSSADVMLALHARRSHPSIKRFPREKRLVVALTGRAERMPTAALVQVRFAVDRWSEVGVNGPGELAQLWYPKEL